MRHMVHEITVLPAIPECPDSPFIEDTVVVFGGRALLAHMGAPSRRPEVRSDRCLLFPVLPFACGLCLHHSAECSLPSQVAGVAPPLQECGIDVRAMAGAEEWAGVEQSQLIGTDVGKEATLDGGDVLAVDSTLFVGLSDRTNEAGASIAWWRCFYVACVTSLSRSDGR